MNNDKHILGLRTCIYVVSDLKAAKVPCRNLAEPIYNPVFKPLEMD